MNDFASKKSLLSYRLQKLTAMLAEELAPAQRKAAEENLEEVKQELHNLRYPVQIEKDSNGKPYVIFPDTLTPASTPEDICTFAVRALNHLRRAA